MLSSPLPLLFSSSCIIFLSSFTVHWRITSCHMFKDLLCYYPFFFSLLCFFSTCFTFTAITFYDQDTIKPVKSPHPWFQICFHFQAAANLFNKHNTIRTGAYAISTVIISNVHRLCISSNSHFLQHFSPNNPHFSSSPLHQYLSPISLSLSLSSPVPLCSIPFPFQLYKEKAHFQSDHLSVSNHISDG